MKQPHRADAWETLFDNSSAIVWCSWSTGNVFCANCFRALLEARTLLVFKKFYYLVVVFDHSLHVLLIKGFAMQALCRIRSCSGSSAFGALTPRPVAIVVNS